MIRHSQGKVVLTQEEKEKQRKLGEKMKKAMENFLKIRRTWTQDEEKLKDMTYVDKILAFNTKFIKLSTDSPTVFNFRKDIINQKFKITKTALGQLTAKMSISEEKEEILKTINKKKENLEQFIKNEIILLSKLVKDDPKSYELWFHRLWLFKTTAKLQKKLKSNTNKVEKMIEMDLGICKKFLMKDERNFHVWNYRLELVKLLLTLSESDKKQKLEIVENQLAFVKEKIAMNFSNYSALHFFTKFSEIKKEIEGKFFLDKKNLNEQFDINMEALFISPNEQALWLYQKWLLENISDIKLLYFNKLENSIFEFYFNIPVKSFDNWEDILSFRNKDNIVVNFSVKKKNSNLLVLELDSDSFENFVIKNRGADINYFVENGELKNCDEKKDDDLIEKIKKNLEIIKKIDITCKETQMFKFFNILYFERFLDFYDLDLDSKNIEIKSEKILSKFVETSSKNKEAMENIYFKNLISETIKKDKNKNRNLYLFSI